MINGSKIILSVLGAMCVFTIAGCKNKIDISAYSENTLALNSDGSVTELSVRTLKSPIILSQIWKSISVRKWISIILSRHQIFWKGKKLNQLSPLTRFKWLTGGRELS